MYQHVIPDRGVTNRVRVDVNSVPSKTCRDCDETKPLDDFYPRKGAKDGRRNDCRDCTKQKAMAVYNANPEAQAAKSKRWQAAHAEEMVERRKTIRAGMSDEDRARESRQKAVYHTENAEKIRAREVAYRLAHPDRIRAQNQAKYYKDVDRSRAEARRYYSAKDPAVTRARNAAYTAANKEKISAGGLAYRALNKERIHAYHARYRAQNPEAGAAASALRLARLDAVLSITPTAEQMASKWAYWGNKCWMCGAPPTTVDHVKPLSKSGPHILANFRPACKSCNSRKHAKWFGPHELHRFIK